MFSTKELKHHIVEGRNHNERVYAVDDVGPGGAHHHYKLEWGDSYEVPPQEIWFQRGGIQNAGINGVSNEQVLAVLIDRFECLMSGPFPTPETQEALDHCRAAMEALHRRTRDRLARDVEGRETA